MADLCPKCDGITVEHTLNYMKELVAQRGQLRAALVGLVGVDGSDQLEAMETVMRALPAPAEDKAAMIDAIHALIATESKHVSPEP